MGMQLGMVVLDVRDLDRSVTFYRQLGLDLPSRSPDRPVSLLRMESGVSLVLVEGFGVTNDANWRRPDGGYQQVLEFFVGGDGSVDTAYRSLTALGYHGRMPPRKIIGPYAAMIDDPDGNVVLISSDQGADPASAPPQ